MRRATRPALLAALVVASIAVGGAGGSGPATARVVVPGCSGSTSTGPNLASASPTFADIGGEPFGVAAVRGYAFVANAAGALDVLADRDSAPRLLHTIRLSGQSQLGMTVTSNRRYLLIASVAGAIVVDVARAEAGAEDAVIGTLGRRSQGFGGAIEVTTSRDGRYAFVSLEDSGQIDVYRLAAAIADHFSKSAYVGAIPTGQAPVGLAVSPDGRWLYSTSEIGGPGGRALGRGQNGSLSVISVAKAERDPAHAVAATVNAGCQPVRVAVSPSGRDVWVTARGSDALVAFSAARLVTDSKAALLASVRVGAAPVGVAVVDDGSRVVVADSNRFSASGQNSALTVVDANAALADRSAVVGTVRAEQFPRDVAVEPAGTVLLVSNFGSGTLEAVHVSDHAQESHASSAKPNADD